MPRYFFNFSQSPNPDPRRFKNSGLGLVDNDASGHGWNLVAARSESSLTAENLQTLIEIQGEVIRCRRLAEDIDDPETAYRLYAIAGEIEAIAREVDARAE
jgi:hypothetical protein